MSMIELTGLRGDLPIAVMAAFGVLRICSRSERIGRTKLCWSGNGGDYRAALVTESEVTAHDLVSVLVAKVREESTLPPWEQIKTVPGGEFRATAYECAFESSSQRRERADWICSLANELAVEKDGKMQRTPFDMSTARQKFLTDARRLAAILGTADQDGRVEGEYKEALFGPWRYRDDQHSLGWDPTTIKLGAFTHKAPTGMTNAGVRAAVMLAFESLPLFPCLYAGRLRTRGFVQKDRDAALIWPVWRPAISAFELATLLAWPALQEDKPNRAEMGARGVMAVFRSERFKPNQYMVTFRPPELAYSEG